MTLSRKEKRSGRVRAGDYVRSFVLSFKVRTNDRANEVFDGLYYHAPCRAWTGTVRVCGPGHHDGKTGFRVVSRMGQCLGV